MVVLGVGMFPRPFWASATTNVSSPLQPWSTSAGIHSPPRVSFSQPLNQDTTEFLPFFGQTWWEYSKGSTVQWSFWTVHVKHKLRKLKTLHSVSSFGFFSKARPRLINQGPLVASAHPSWQPAPWPPWSYEMGLGQASKDLGMSPRGHWEYQKGNSIKSQTGLSHFLLCPHCIA